MISVTNTMRDNSRYVNQIFLNQITLNEMDLFFLFNGQLNYLITPWLQDLVAGKWYLELVKQNEAELNMWLPN